MTNATKLIAGLLLIAVTTIEYGGTFLLSMLTGKYAGFTEFQRSMFRAGHAHAGVLTILPGMVERRRGGVLNIGWGAGLTVLPNAAAYVGSKHFVAGFSEGCTPIFQEPASL